MRANLISFFAFLSLLLSTVSACTSYDPSDPCYQPSGCSQVPADDDDDSGDDDSGDDDATDEEDPTPDDGDDDDDSTAGDDDSGDDDSADTGDDDTTPPDDDDVTPDDDDSATPPGDDDDSASDDDDITPPDDDDSTPADDDDVTPPDDDDTTPDDDDTTPPADDDDSTTPPGDDDDSTPADDDDDVTPDDDDTTPPPAPTSQECWDAIAFQIQNRYIDWSIATTVAGNWSGGLDWVDTDPVQVLDASASTNLVTVYTAGNCGGSVEAVMYFPTGYSFPDLGDQYNNGIATFLQPDGTVLEINYLASCGDGSWHGYVLPDSNPLDACDEGIDTTRWIGAQGGSHFTATQALREGELVGSDPIGRPLVVEVDHFHLYYGTDGFRWPAASADGYASSLYSGTIPDLQMGSILVLPESYNCASMTTTPGERLCEVGRDHGFVIVDDSYGTNEVAFPMTPAAQAEVEASLGYSLHNSQGTGFGADVETMMVSVRVLTNPESAWVE